jgi:hypothetical protein
VASIAAFVGDVFTMPPTDDSVLTMPQQLAAGSTIDDDTIVSQQAARRQTSRPQQSYVATVSHAGAQAGAHAGAHAGAQQLVAYTGSQHGAAQQLERRCRQPASASPAATNAARHTIAPTTRTRILPVIVETLRDPRAQNAAKPTAGRHPGGGQG